MKNTYPIYLSLLSSLSFLSLPIEAKEIQLVSGQLPGEMAAIMASDDNTLILKGTATPFDLTSLRALPSHVTTLDISQLTIRGGQAIGGEWFGRTEFADGEIPAYMLLGTNISVISLPPSVSAIGAGAFSGTPLKEFMANGVQKVGEAAFYNCNQLRKVDFQNAGFTEIPPRLFSGCVELEDIHVPHLVTTVGHHAFEKCKMESISLPNAMEIDDYAFSHASSLNEIRFGLGCRMGEGVFYGAGSLSSLPSSPSNLPDLFSTGGNGLEVIAVKSAEVGEGAFSRSGASIITFTSDVRKIHAYAFHSMPNLEKVVAEACLEIPDADPEAFAANDVSKVLLHVGRGNADRWRSAPVWQNFKITEEESGVSETLMASSNVRIEKRGNSIAVVSALPIQEVALYSVAGETITLASPDAESFEITYPEGYDVVIVKGVAGKEVNVVKLTK